MILSPMLNEALAGQVLKEYSNMLLYKQIESFFEELQLSNIAKYFFKQSQEEKSHGDKIVEYINSRNGGKITCGNVEYIPREISLENVGLIYVQAEEETSESIEEIYGIALEERSFMDLGFLEKMLSEQVEEEDSANKFMKNISMAKDLVLFDASLGK